MKNSVISKEISVPIGRSIKVQGILGLPPEPMGLILFVQGTSGGRTNPRNSFVAAKLQAAGLATLLADFLTEEEEKEKQTRFKIDLLTQRLLMTHDWMRSLIETNRLPIGYFGSSTGAAAALQAAAVLPGEVGAVVCCGGRSDLAETYVYKLISPTLLIVGEKDQAILELNKITYSQMTCPKDLIVVPGATHLFEEEGAQQMVSDLAIQWFQWYLRADWLYDETRVIV